MASREPKIPLFDPDVDKWDFFLMRLHSQFVVNGWNAPLPADANDAQRATHAQNESKKKNSLFAQLNPTAMMQFCDCMRANPKNDNPESQVDDYDYTELSAFGNQLWRHQISPMAALTQFLSMKRSEGETAQAFMSRLRAAAEPCQFQRTKRSLTDFHLFAQFVRGIEQPEVQAFLSAEDMEQYTMAQVVTFASNHLNARNWQQQSQGAETVQFMNSNSRNGNSNSTQSGRGRPNRPNQGRQGPRPPTGHTNNSVRYDTPCW
jgi:hypothetical protein